MSDDRTPRPGRLLPGRRIRRSLGRGAAARLARRLPLLRRQPPDRRRRPRSLGRLGAPRLDRRAQLTGGGELRQHPQARLVLRAGRGGEDDELLGEVLGGEDLAVEREQRRPAGARSASASRPACHLVALPQRRRTPRSRPAGARPARRLGVLAGAARGRRAATATWIGASASWSSSGWMPRAAGIGEPAVDQCCAAGRCSRSGRRRAPRPGVLAQRHAEVGDDLRGRVELVEHAQQPRAGMVGAKRPRRRRVAGEREQVVALVLREAQRARQRGRPSAPRAASRAAAPGARRSRSTCGPARRPPRGAAGRAPPRPGARPTSSGCSAVAPAPQEVGQSVAIHVPSMQGAPRRIQGQPVPG